MFKGGMDHGGTAAGEGGGPPRTLDVQKFAAARSREVQALYDALKARTTCSIAEHSSLTIARHLRRRTASHNRRLPFRWKRNATRSRKGSQAGERPPSARQSNAAPASEEKEEVEEKEVLHRKRKDDAQLPSRRVRRRVELRGVTEGTWTCARDGTRRLASHVWHAKRFPMTRLWGYYLPLGLPGRGRGSKAVFKWVKDAAVLHDASYLGLIELQGIADAILQILCRVLDPPPRLQGSGIYVREEEMHGLLYSNAVLHNVGSSPLEAIVPVTILWRPRADYDKGQLEPSASQQRAVEERQLWMWMHPSAFECVLQILSELCKMQGRNNPQATVKCVSRRGELARLDLLGGKASHVLRKVLRPVTRMQTSADTRKSISEILLSRAASLPGAAVLALDVLDPRDNLGRSSGNPASSLQRAQHDSVNGNGETDVQSTINSAVDKKRAYGREDLALNSEDAAAIGWEDLIKNRLAREVSDSPYLWSPSTDLKVTAISQKAMSRRRHIKRQANFSNIENDVLYTRWDSNASIGAVERGAVCPVLLLKQAHSKLSASGWSIIIPTTWVQAFWVPLVFAGGHVIGLRERRWLATDAGIACFPEDFPDCVAHAQHLDSECRAFETENLKRPPSKRAPEFAISPLQRSALTAYRGRLSEGGQCTFCGVRYHLSDDCNAEKCAAARSTHEMTNDDTAISESTVLATKAAVAPVSRCTVDHIVRPKFANTGGELSGIGPGFMADGLLSSQVGEVIHRPNITRVAVQKDPHPRGMPAGAECRQLSDSTDHREFAYEEIENNNLIAVGAGRLFLDQACDSVDQGSVQQSVRPANNCVNGVFDSLAEMVPLTSTSNCLDGVMVSKCASVIPDIFMDDADAVAPVPPLKLKDNQATDRRRAQVMKPDASFPTIEADYELGGTENLSTPSHSLTGNASAVTDRRFYPCDIDDDFGAFSSKARATTPPDTLAAESEPREVRSQPLPGSVTVERRDVLEVPKSLYDRETPTSALTFTDLPRTPSAPQIVNESGNWSLIEPVTNDSKAGNGYLRVGEQSSPLGSMSQQVVSNRCKIDKCDAAGRPSGNGKSLAKEMIITELMETASMQVKNLSNTLAGLTPPVHMLTGCGLQPPTCVSLADMRPSMDLAMRKKTFFVARTVGALTEALNAGGLRHALLLRPSSTGKGSVRCGLRQGTLEWRPCRAPGPSIVAAGTNDDSAAAARAKKTGCHVRVLIHIPRKGVMKERDVLCAPTRNDFNAFLNRSQRWQGVETWWTPKMSKNRNRESKNTMATGKSVDLLHDANALARGFPNLDSKEFAQFCSREILGCITSVGPPGSTWAGTGICEVGSLLSLRAVQWSDQRWWPSKEILLLFGNMHSAVLHPILVSVALESGQDAAW